MVKAGEMIKNLREQAGLTQEQLADGIMDRTNLARLELGIQAVSKTKIENLLNRLGQSSERFFSYALTNEEFELYDLRERLDEYIGRNETENAEKLLAQIEQLPAFQTGVHKKFLLSSRAAVWLMKENDPETALAWLNEAIRINIPKFEEKLVAVYPLTREDIEIINAMANAYYAAGQTAKAIELLEKLAKNIRKRYVDKKEKARALSLVLYNLSKYKGLMEDYTGSLAACDEAILGCINHNEYEGLPYLVNNKAYDFYHLGKKEDCKKLIYQTYYCFKIMGIENMAQMVKESAASDLGIFIIE